MHIGEYALPLSLLLCGFIIFVEIYRQRGKLKIDLLFAVNVIYFISFGLVPFSIFTMDLTYYPDTHRIRYLPIENSAYFFATLVSIISYTLILIGYYCGKKIKFTKSKKSIKVEEGNVNKFEFIYPLKKVTLVAFLLFIIGTLSILIYVYSIGGIKYALETATLYRSGKGEVGSKFLFLKNVAPLVHVSSYIYFSLLYKDNNQKKFFNFFMFLLSLVVSLYTLMILSGRLSMVSFLVVFPLFIVLYKKKGSFKFIIGSLIISFLAVIFGDSFFNVFNNPNLFISQINAFKFDILRLYKDIILEFSFPYINLVHLLLDTREIVYRFFSDLFIAILQLIPQSLTGVTTPESISSINTAYFGTIGRGTIPVDLISFGYYSFNLPGVLLVTFIFGLIVSGFEKLFPPQKSVFEIVFRAAWIVFIAFRVMYGDPSMIIQGGFKLIVGSILLFKIRTYKHKKIVSF